MEQSPERSEGGLNTVARRSVMPRDGTEAMIGEGQVVSSVEGAGFQGLKAC